VAVGDTFAEIGREYLDKRIREGMARPPRSRTNIT
jgi:hypothetical protein